MFGEKITNFMKKWKRPEIELTEKQKKELAEFERKQYFKALKRKRAREIAERYAPGKRGIPGESIFDTLASSTREILGESKGGGISLLHLESPSRFGLGALEAEGIISRPKAHKKR